MVPCFNLVTKNNIKVGVLWVILVFVSLKYTFMETFSKFENFLIIFRFYIDDLMRVIDRLTENDVHGGLHLKTGVMTLVEVGLSRSAAHARYIPILVWATKLSDFLGQNEVRKYLNRLGLFLRL